MCRYGFECPVHGLEIQAFCFRAFDEKAIAKWKKIKLVLNNLNQGQEEEVMQLIRKQK